MILLWGGSFWPKDSLITYIIFELCLIWYISPVANFGTHPLFWTKNCKMEAIFATCYSNKRSWKKRHLKKKQFKELKAQVRGRQVHLLKVYVAPSYILLFYHSLVVNQSIRTIHILRQQRGRWVLKIDSLDGVQYFIYADLTP